MHYCKVCNRGFMCGEALGGHMRAHGLVDTHNYYEESASRSNFEDKPADDVDGNKHSYFLRTTSDRFLSCKAREACSSDKISLTWPDDNENGKCSTNEMVSPIPWQMQSELENDESCASSQEEDQELANCLVLLSSNPFVFSSEDQEEDHKAADVVLKGNFQCKGCKKVFNSHQALGGHRASHKNVKGCFANSSFDHNLTDDEKSEDLGTSNNVEFLYSSRSSNYQFSSGGGGVARDSDKDGPVLEAARRAPWNFHTKKKARVHECSICYRVFSSGQALGGHKRCHWLSSSTLPERQHVDQQKLVFTKPMVEYHDQKSEGHDQVDLDFYLMSNNYLPHLDEAGIPRANYNLPTTQKEGAGGDQAAMADLSRHEEDGRSKKLEKLRNMDLEGGSSTWLQMGITSTTWS